MNEPVAAFQYISWGNMPTRPKTIAYTIWLLNCFTMCHFSLADSLVCVFHIRGINNMMASVGRQMVANPIINPVNEDHRMRGCSCHFIVVYNTKMYKGKIKAWLCP